MTSSLFARLADVSRRAVERVHGDAVMVYPVARPGGVNGPRTVTLADGFATVVCFFENTLAENDALARPLTGNGRMMAAQPAVFGSITLVAGKSLDAGFVLQREDDGAVFEIVSFKPDGLGAALAGLNRLSGLPEVG